MKKTEKGQIVEILATSPLYQKELPFFDHKHDELTWKIQQRRYSLFDGFLVGEHQGLDNFSLGQRKGLNIGGKQQPLYVIGIDRKENRLFVGQGDTHPGLFQSTFQFSENDFQYQSDSLQQYSLLEQGCEIEISSPFQEEMIQAKLYKFGIELFLEYFTPILIRIENYPIQIYYQQQLFANLIRTI